MFVNVLLSIMENLYPYFVWSLWQPKVFCGFHEIDCQFLLVIKIQQKLLIQRGIPQIMRQTDVNLHKTKR